MYLCELNEGFIEPLHCGRSLLRRFVSYVCDPPVWEVLAISRRKFRAGTEVLPYVVFGKFRRQTADEDS
jgi:hypothetical protein